jgi:hypothetical protein
MASLQSRISDLIAAIGADVKILRTTSTGSIAAQTLGTGDTYIAGSSPPAFPAGKIQAGTFYRVKLDMAKTAAGTAVATFTLRMGTLGTTGDAAICTFTAPSAQTAAIDNGQLEILANFRSVGSGTSAVVEGLLVMIRTNTTTGFLSTGGLQIAPLRVTSGGFDSTTVTRIGISINPGASSSWSTQVVQSEVKNLAA